MQPFAPPPALALAPQMGCGRAPLTAQFSNGPLLNTQPSQLGHPAAPAAPPAMPTVAPTVAPTVVAATVPQPSAPPSTPPTQIPTLLAAMPKRSASPMNATKEAPAAAIEQKAPQELEMLQQFRKTKRPEFPTKKPKVEGQDLEWQDFLEMLQQFRKAKREESPTKQHNTDLDWQDFLEALAAKDVELFDLDFGLQQELLASAQARQEFLALNLTAPDTFHYDPEHGKFQLDLSKKRLPWIGNEPDFKSFTFADWPLYFILFYYIDPRIDDWFPLPHPVKTKFSLPNFDKDQIDYIKSVYSINDRLLTDRLFTCQWYADNIDNYTRYQQKHILDQWKISFTDNTDIDPDRIINIPWDSLVATSALNSIDPSFTDNTDIDPDRIINIPWDSLVATSALNSIDPDHIDYFPENLNDGFWTRSSSPFPNMSAPSTTLQRR
eukprot:s155_g15.t1